MYYLGSVLFAVFSALETYLAVAYGKPIAYAIAVFSGLASVLCSSLASRRN